MRCSTCSKRRRIRSVETGRPTVRVLKALLPVAVRQLQGPATDSFTLSVNGQPVTGETAEALKVDSRLLDVPRSIDLSAMVHAGTTPWNSQDPPARPLQTRKFPRGFMYPGHRRQPAKRRRPFPAGTSVSNSPMVGTLQMPKSAIQSPALSTPAASDRRAMA